MAEMIDDFGDGTRVWLASVPANLLVRAASAEEAESAVVALLERHGFTAHEEHRMVFASEPVDADDVVDGRRVSSLGVPCEHCRIQAGLR